MKVSVIVPFKEADGKLIRCLESVKNQDYKDVEIIAVSDRDEVKNDGVISIRGPGCRGPGAKRNLGARHARGEIFFFLDSDCILKRDSISKLVEIFRARGIDAVSGKPLAYENSSLLCFITGLEYEDRFEQMGEGFVDVAASTCLGIKREVFFDVEGFVDYSDGDAIGEDWDLSARLRSREYRIYHTNEVEVFHEHNSQNLWHYLRKQYGHAKYRITHFKKYRKAVDQYATWSMILSSTLLLSLPATIRILRRTGNTKALLLPLIALLRSMAWLSGAAAGIFSLKKFSDAG